MHMGSFNSILAPHVTQLLTVSKAQRSEDAKCVNKILAGSVIPIKLTLVQILRFRSHKRTLVRHMQQAKDEDHDLRIMLEEGAPNGAVGVETLLLTATMDVLLQPTARMSMDAQSVFVMITGL